MRTHSSSAHVPCVTAVCWRVAGCASSPPPPSGSTISTPTDADRRITWSNAPGCNSAAWPSHLQSSLLLLQELQGMRLPELTLGVVGVGNVGGKVAGGSGLGVRPCC